MENLQERLFELERHTINSMMEALQLKGTYRARIMIIQSILKQMDKRALELANDAIPSELILELPF